MRACWLAQFSDKPCQGRTDRAHLIQQQLLRREGHAEMCDDERTWVPACRYHHGSWDAYRGLVVPRDALPEAFLGLMDELGLEWAVTRRYGPEEAF